MVLLSEVGQLQRNQESKNVGKNDRLAKRFFFFFNFNFLHLMKIIQQGILRLENMHQERSRQSEDD